MLGHPVLCMAIFLQKRRQDGNNLRPPCSAPLPNQTINAIRHCPLEDVPYILTASPKPV